MVSRRHGFAGAADYYARASVGPRLASLRVPALAVIAVADPMVPAATLRPWLEPPPPRLTAHWVPRAGHVAFSGGLDLGYGARPGLSEQLLGWCESAVR